MCGEITTVCTDCGAERFLFWDECKHYWRLYAAALEEGPGEAKPQPEDCIYRECVERAANLGTCPNLDNCISSVRLRNEQAKAERRCIAAARAQLEREKREGRYKAAFAKQYFCKRPVPAVPPPPPPSEHIGISLGSEEPRQRGQEEQLTARRGKGPEHQEAKEAARETLRRQKRKLRSRARGCALSSGGSESQSQSQSQSQSEDSPPSAQDSPCSTQDSGSSTQPREALEVPDSDISLIVTEPGEAVEAADSGVSLTMPDAEAGAAQLHQRRARPSNASSEATTAVAEPSPKPSCTSANSDDQDTCQRGEGGEAAAKGAGRGAALGMVGHIWGRISAGLGIVR
ncbi:hypothetical protein TCAP_04559 [Tolypocladium capitatum]|uniref:Uncharacterized protein n=1 Tax=Tolypocladium capitatum TaxID=45235 RepID=A0A2K3QD88_9HYPO|nr:hypothetical protein TCAP_04559 [Tolypocladium capitatum]